MTDPLSHAVLLIPAFNEEASLPQLLNDIHALYPHLPIVVINDASRDQTSGVARSLGAQVIDLPTNLGVAGAMQAGFRWAYDHGFAYVLRCDADGQHPPAGFRAIADKIAEPGVDMVIGSRFRSGESFSNPLHRRIGILYLCRFLNRICRKTEPHELITDPTSGFQMINRPLMRYFAYHYPADYPEPESIALVTRLGYNILEVGVPFQARTGGTSSLTGMKSLYFALKVTLSLMIDRVRAIDNAYARESQESLLP
jgi:glycosyltransferase involved in cell wall biosynthesis